MAANTFVPLGKDPGSPYGYIMVKPETAVIPVFPFHGIGERGNGKTELVRLERNGVPWVNKEGLINEPNLAMFCPQQNKYNAKGEELKKFYWRTMIDFMVHIVTKYDLSRKVRVTGLSMGAHSISLLMDELKKDPAAAKGLEIECVLLVAGVGDHRKGASYAPARLRTVHGLEDTYSPVFSSELVKTYNTALSSATVPLKPAEFIPMPFLGHENAVWNSVYRSKSTWQWMLNS